MADYNDGVNRGLCSSSCAALLKTLIKSCTFSHMAASAHMKRMIVGMAANCWKSLPEYGLSGAVFAGASRCPPPSACPPARQPPSAAAVVVRHLLTRRSSVSGCRSLSFATASNGGSGPLDQGIADGANSF